MRRGDFSARLPTDQTGVAGEIYATLNEILELNRRMADELGQVIGAVARGDLSRSMTEEIAGRPLEGELLRTARSVNTMVEQLRSFAAEVTCVAREVGTEAVEGAPGTWKDLSDSVQAMAANLTGQVRNIAEVTKAVATRLTLQQEELKQTNAELEERSELLQLQNARVERKNREIEQAKVELEERAQQLALSSKYKSEFLANMSHELRTPLNSLLILARLLADNPKGNLDGEQVEFARTIHSAGSDLLSLINDILDLSKVESGTMAIDVDELELELLQDHVERNFMHVAHGKDLEFNVEIDADAPKVIYTDPRRLQQVLKNLLSNAFKFTDRGGVSLRMSLATEGWGPDNEVLDHSNAVLAFSVTDTGIGIPLHKQKIIFEAFQQADGTTSRKYGGTGLGLSISRELARLLGGEIRVSSVHGGGSTFTLYVPQTHAPAPGSASQPPALLAARAQPPALLVAPAFSGKKALVVDDDVRNIFAITSVLERYQMSVVYAEDGRRGIELLREHPDVDVVLMDVMMPAMDGHETTREIRKEARFADLPIIALTAKAMKGDREKCLEAGASDYITKPVEPEQLLALLRVWLDR